MTGAVTWSAPQPPTSPPPISASSAAPSSVHHQKHHQSHPSTASRGLQGTLIVSSALFTQDRDLPPSPLSSSITTPNARFLRDAMTSEKASLLEAAVPQDAVTPARHHRCHKRRRFLHGAVLTLGGLALWRACSSSMATTRAPPVSEPASSNICTTPACVHASSEILYNLSPNYKDIDPCTDFEEMVCGGWRERHDLRPDQGDAFTGTIMAENSQLLLRHILEAPYPKSSRHSFFSPMQLAAASHSADEDNFDKMTSAYKACVDEETIKKLGVAPLAKIVDEIKSVYPASIKSENALSDTILLLARYGVSGLVASGTGADDTNPDVVVVSVSPPWRIGLPSKERYEDDALVKKYQAVVVEVLSQLSPNEKKETLAAVVDLEKKLAAASPSAEDRQDITVRNPRTSTWFVANSPRNPTTQCPWAMPRGWFPRSTSRTSSPPWHRLKRWTVSLSLPPSTSRNFKPSSKRPTRPWSRTTLFGRRRKPSTLTSTLLSPSRTRALSTSLLER